MPDEDTQAYPLDETVDKVEPEFGDLKKREAMSSLHVLNKVEDVSDPPCFAGLILSLSLWNNYGISITNS
jgi:hypothetical protein